jgi:hypothetical protein
MTNIDIRKDIIANIKNSIFSKVEWDKKQYYFFDDFHTLSYVLQGDGFIITFFKNWFVKNSLVENVEEFTVIDFLDKSEKIISVSLEGDFRGAYSEVIKDGFDACMNVFESFKYHNNGDISELFNLDNSH